MNKYTLVLLVALFGLISCQTPNECGVKYCVQCDKTTNQCEVCKGGWYLGKDNVCHAQCLKGSMTAVANCTDYDGAGNCTQCKGGYYLSKGVCHAQCLNGSMTSVANCTDYDGAGNCTQCKGGYYLSKGVCHAQCLRTADSTCSVKFCTTCDALNKCIQCKGGYYLANNVCHAQCLTGYVLNKNNKCEKESEFDSIIRKFFGLF